RRTSRAARARYEPARSGCRSCSRSGAGWVAPPHRLLDYELVALPSRGKRSRLCLAVPDDACHHESRVVQHGAIGMAQRVAELPSLVYRPGCLRGHMARDATREGKLLEETLHSRLI